MYEKVTLLIGKFVLEEEIKQIVSLAYPTKLEIDYFEHSYKINNFENSLFILYLNDDEIRLFLKKIDKKVNIAILPNKYVMQTMEAFKINANLEKALRDAFNEEKASDLDLLLCNNEIVLQKVLIGEVHGLNRYVKFFQKLKFLKFQNYTFITAKEQVVQTTACGVTIFEGYTPNDTTSFKEHLSFHDGQLSSFIFAPHSLLSYIWYMIGLFFYQRFSLKTLPKSLGYIKTSKLTINSNKAIEYRLDDKLLCAKELIFEIKRGLCKIHVGEQIEAQNQNILQSANVDVEESIKVTSLPSGELKEFLIEGNIPLFKRAGNDEFKTLFTTLRESASFSSSFAVLMILSVLLATTGLYANSSPVIIGAMILAPLMSPIISLAMGTIRLDISLLVKSTKTLSFGIFLALFVSSCYALIIPLEQITQEMTSRLHPNLLDLIVAILSGIAGAYAHAKEEIAKSLAGVAIAVALVPPLSVSGIGLGMMNFDVIYGAFLLFVTNFIGIILSASLTFVVLGFAPIKKAVKSLMGSFTMMIIISIPLVISFSQLVEQNKVFKEVSKIKSVKIGDEKVFFNVKSIEIKKEAIYLELELLTSHMINLQELYKVKENLERKLGKEVHIQASIKLTL